MIDQDRADLPFDVPRETYDRLRTYLDLLLAEAERQNLIAKSTAEEAWQRHIVDSAQLISHAPAGFQSWLDVGSGAGLPGIVIAIICGRSVTMAEPRRLRAEFLRRCVDHLNLSGAAVVEGKVDQVSGQFDIISARAVASVASLFSMTRRLAHPGTRWILPKGRSAAKELAEAQASWQGRFRLEPSITAPDAMIVLAEGVAPKGRARGRA